jgi:hypothetical protein
MADQIIASLKSEKTIIITGNFHMGGPYNVRAGIIPALDYVREKTSMKILKIGLKYSGGNLYNYGVKNLISRNYVPLTTLTTSPKSSPSTTLFFLSNPQTTHL